MTSYNWIYTHTSTFPILEGLIFMPNLCGRPAQYQTDVMLNRSVLHAHFKPEYSHTPSLEGGVVDSKVWFNTPRLALVETT
jgi:hypothetical protein